MSMMKKLELIRAALSDLEVRTYHYAAGSSPGKRFIVWAEEGEYDVLLGNDRKLEKAWNGYVDYFTDIEYDPIVMDIEDALNGIDGCIASIESVQYGDPTIDDDNLIHYTWNWRIM